MLFLLAAVKVDGQGLFGREGFDAFEPALLQRGRQKLHHPTPPSCESSVDAMYRRRATVGPTKTDALPVCAFLPGRYTRSATKDRENQAQMSLAYSFEVPSQHIVHLSLNVMRCCQQPVQKAMPASSSSAFLMDMGVPRQLSRLLLQRRARASLPPCCAASLGTTCFRECVWRSAGKRRADGSNPVQLEDIV